LATSASVNTRRKRVSIVPSLRASMKRVAAAVAQTLGADEAVREQL
jgi:hypothetical protein